MVDLDELAEAVRRAGGEEAAAGILSISVSTVKRWLTGAVSIPRTREKALGDFIDSYSGEQERRPLGTYTSKELLDELALRRWDDEGLR